MAGVPKLFTSELLAANDVVVRLLDDLVDEQKRLTVRDGGFDGFEGHLFFAADVADDRRFN